MAREPRMKIGSTSLQLKKAPFSEGVATKRVATKYRRRRGCPFTVGFWGRR